MISNTSLLLGVKKKLIQDIEKGTYDKEIDEQKTELAADKKAKLKKFFDTLVKEQEAARKAEEEAAKAEEEAKAKEAEAAAEGEAKPAEGEAAAPAEGAAPAEAPAEEKKEEKPAE